MATKAKFSVGDSVIATDDLTNSSGSIIRAKKGETLRLVGFGFTTEMLIVEGKVGRFACWADSVKARGRKREGSKRG